MQSTLTGPSGRHQPITETPSTQPADVFRRGPREFLDVGHSRLAYYRFGSGPDLVLIHGWPLNAATFRNLIPHLVDRYTCHVFDLPGAGRTETTENTPYSLEGHVETVRRAIRTLGLSRYVLVAHDSGGYVARLVAADDDRVAGLVLGNTEIPGHTPPLIVAYALLSKVPGFGEVMRAVLRIGALRRSPLGFGSCFESSNSIGGEFSELIVEPLLASPLAMDKQLELLRSLDAAALTRAMRSAHDSIRARTLLVWGSADPFFPIEKARQMVPELRAGATLAEIPGGSLFAHEERAEEFARHALPFLDSCFDVPQPS